jgi:molybdopterin-containing oxidoreductase family membrane subunit
VIYFAFEFSEFSIHLWNPEGGAPAVELVLFGPYWWMFWFIHLLAGGLVPLVLLAMQRRIAWVAGALLVAVMFVSSRLNVLIPGQSVGEIEGLQEAFQHTKLSYVYSATTMEYLVACLLLAVGLTVFFIGRRLDSKMNPSE